MKIDAAPSGDGIWYFANSTYFAAEWISYLGYSVDARIQFTVEWTPSTPSVWVYKYYRVADSGSSCTVGIQGGPRGPFAQYSLDQALIPAGTMVTCNTAASGAGGSCTATSFDIPDLP
jgi:hypothetical protein